jgi:hypothetical protein
MGSLDIWGAIAASVLLIQCLIFNLFNVALAVGLWYGAKWLREHSRTGLQTADNYLKQGQEIAVKGQSQVVGPFITLRARVAEARAFMQRLRGSS